MKERPMIFSDGLVRARPIKPQPVMSNRIIDELATQAMRDMVAAFDAALRSRGVNEGNMHMYRGRVQQVCFEDNPNLHILTLDGENICHFEMVCGMESRK